MRRTEEETRNGGMPMSRRRAMVEGQSLVCRVVRTRWPVRAARTPIWAVSRSRVSPTRMPSASWRTTERRAAVGGGGGGAGGAAEGVGGGGRVDVVGGVGEGVRGGQDVDVGGVDGVD